MMCVKPSRSNKYSVALVGLTIAAVVGIGASAARAQNARIHHQIVTERDAPPTMGRDFWFAIPSNFFGVDQGGKYLQIYITSTQNTTAYVGIGMAYTTIPITAYSVATFKAPEPWELETSGDVGNNAVHVFSKDADLAVYFMSHNLATSDGTYLIPTIGWGTDNVVAGYEGLLEGTADYPSEFTIAANTDNTVVQVTPSCDFRATGNPTGVAHSAGQTFTITLQRGQSVQYMPVQATDVTGFDVTGTVMHSNHPVGIIGGSMCTNIPIEFQYCDHVEHMIPPVRTWGETYYGTYFAQPTGASIAHEGAQYLFISSKAGQVIWRENKQTGVQQEDTIAAQYGVYWDELQLAQKFWSDAPFLMVEYINSASYPDMVNGNGDPAEVVINSREQFTKTAILQVPFSGNGQRPWTNYATVIVNVNDVERTTYDGKSLSKYISSVQHVDDTFDIFTVPNISPGAHIVTGDSAGVGVYVYGYGYDESYAWSGPLGLGSFHPQDTVAPVADTSGSCYDAFVHLSDVGALQSKLNKIQIDSDYNMNFTLDTGWTDGVGIDTSGYGVSVIDRNDSAYLQVSVYDVAGNVTTITSTYLPHSVTITTQRLNFGTVSLTGSKMLLDSITNTGTTTFTPTEVKLALGNQGFTLVDESMGPVAPGEKMLVKIEFQPIKGQEVYDTILLGDECLLDTIVVEGNGGASAPDFSVDDQSWINVPLQHDTGWVQLPVVIHNKSTQDLGVKFDSVSDPIHFYLAPYQTDSVTVPKKASLSAPDGLDSVWFIYQPTANEQDGARGYWHSPDVLEADGKTPSVRNDSLHGNPASSSVLPGSNSGAGFTLSATPNPVTGSEITFSGATGIAANLTLTVYDVLGREVGQPIDNKYHEAGRWESSFDISKLPSGTYTYRLQIGQTAISKQFMIQR